MTLRTLTALALFVFSIPLHAQIHSLSFAAKVDFTSGTGTSAPQGVAATDIDGDGKTDLLVLNVSNNTFSVFRNTGTNVFNSSMLAGQSTFSTLSNSIEIRTDDLDGDNKPDVVVSSYAANVISVFRNTSTTGNIGFATRTDFTTGTNPSPVAIFDIDNDGKKDVVAGNFGSNTFSTFRNTSTPGAITFATRQDFTVSGGAATTTRELAAADFDGDGKQDLAVLFYNGYIAVFRNISSLGIVSFAASVNAIGVNLNCGLAAGDIDGDNKPDLAVSNYNGASELVFKNYSTPGIISFPSYVSFATGANPHYNIITDIDNDNKPDLLVTNRGSNTISILKNTSATGVINANTFAAKVDFNTGLLPMSFALADLNADGRRELIIPNASSSTFSILKNQVITGLIAHYPLNGNANDTATYAINGTPGASASATTNRHYKASSAMQFDGTLNSNVTTPTSPVFNISGMPGTSVSLWMKADSVFPFQATRVVYMFYDGQRTNELLFNYTTRKLFVSNWGGAASVYSLPSNKTLTRSSLWYHVVVTIDSIGSASQQIKLYVNDSLDFTQSVTMSKPLASAFYLSKQQNVGTNWSLSGAIDDVRIYSRAITSTEVHTLYLADIPNDHYYSKATGNLNQLSTWGTNPDGSGTSPLSFDSSKVTYHVANNTSPQLGGTLKIGGTQTQLVFGDGINPFNLSIGTGDTISCDSMFLNSNITLTITGTLATQKLSSAASSTVQYLGTGAQSVASGIYYNLYVIGGLKTLTGNTTVKGTLGMFASVNNPSFNFMLGTDTANRGTLNRSSGTVYGKFSRWFNAVANSGSSGLFPVGTAARYAPFSLDFTAPSSTGGLVTAAFIPLSPGNNGLPVFDAAGGFVFVDKAAVNGYWQISSTISSGTFTSSVTANNFSGVNDYLALRLIKRSIAGSWTIPGTALTNTGSNSSAVVARSGLTALAGEYGIGGDQSQNPLPVKLISLSAALEKDGKTTLLNWSTAYESNNSLFEIQRSTNNDEFAAVGRVKGSGTTSDAVAYQYKDDVSMLDKQNTPAIFYRLKQIDLDGRFSYSKTVSVQPREKQNSFVLYPNPSNSHITLSGLEQPVTVCDLYGNEVMSIKENGTADISALKNGVYLIRSGTMVQKLVKY